MPRYKCGEESSGMEAQNKLGAGPYKNNYVVSEKEGINWLKSCKN
jgi:hypothetical protein